MKGESLQRGLDRSLMMLLGSVPGKYDQYEHMYESVELEG